MKKLSTRPVDQCNVTISGARGPGTQTIVFLHGLGGDQTMWRLLTPAFEARYQLVLLDLVGAGRSDVGTGGPATHGSLHGHATDLLEAMRALALHDAVFVGHSVGAMIGMLAAVREPQRFAKLVLISPSPRFLDEAGHAGGFEQKDINELLAAMEGDHRGWSQAFAPVLTGKDERPELVMELTNSFVRTNPEIARHFARLAFFSDCRADLDHITIPTLIVQSAHDVIAPLAVGQYLHAQLADSRLAVVDTDGHYPHLSAPNETLAAMRPFIG